MEIGKSEREKCFQVFGLNVGICVSQRDKINFNE